jgi:hypothetical protein
MGVIPALTGVAVKVTVAPWQILFEPAAILMPAVYEVLTCITTGFEMAGFPEIHCSSEDISQVIISPSFGMQVKVGRSDPVFTAFNFH